MMMPTPPDARSGELALAGIDPGNVDTNLALYRELELRFLVLRKKVINTPPGYRGDAEKKTA